MRLLRPLSEKVTTRIAQPDVEAFVFGCKKARRFPSGEIVAPLTFGSSKRSFSGIGGLLADCASKSCPENSLLSINSSMEISFIFP